MAHVVTCPFHMIAQQHFWDFGSLAHLHTNQLNMKNCKKATVMLKSSLHWTQTNHSNNIYNSKPIQPNWLPKASLNMRPPNKVALTFKPLPSSRQMGPITVRHVICPSNRRILMPRVEKANEIDCGTKLKVLPHSIKCIPSASSPFGQQKWPKHTLSHRLAAQGLVWTKTTHISCIKQRLKGHYSPSLQDHEAPLEGFTCDQKN